ncbi:copper chaperone CopZ [Vagococcus carniphilus]|uniref:Copper chaperone CopZ n=1 Tax=Vagococcus carniphilus TaxID=218144 RepID=A0A430AXN5_9ENTE|nr:copper chaperone CopZ [Vagococcus carniphilus]MDT2815354.1 copper chaperone CopZ [Vagococcus carniphilus]MDT2830661.1 copper chaperone CopZ [Vagococcus carniphilus]MDT2832971.1 copper chaperone CopZ [Vagococcus carniphilus]MDT2839567.1 copper chaperone CopZ [Vagococcus carniphilus]MDT2849542.1 copper chaperone CopZ [Vagococcus carniphilus]
MKQTIKINGMSCEHCVGKVEKAVSELDGVDKIKVKLKNAEAKIKFDETKIPLEKILETVTELGYEASSI